MGPRAEWLNSGSTDRATSPSSRADDLEAALLSTGDVEDCVVLACEVDGRSSRIAYIVPRPQVPFDRAGLERKIGDLVGADRAPQFFVQLRGLPLTSDGAIDQSRLQHVEALDGDLIQRWEQEIRLLPSVRDVIVVAEEVAAASRPLHLSDLLDRWTGAADGGSTKPTRVDDLTGVAPDARPLASADGGPLDVPADAPGTLTEALLRSAASPLARPIRLLQADGSERVLTYSALLEAARRMLSGLRRQGLCPGDAAILQIPDLAEYFPAFWACLLGGIRPVTVAVPSQYDAKNSVVRKLFNTWKLLDAPPILAARDLVEPIRRLEAELGMAGVRVAAVGELLDDPPALDHYASRPEDVAFFQLSSGSTGNSKCIQITHGGVVHHIHASRELLGLSPDDITLNWLPMDHVVPLLMYHVKDVYMGCEQVQVPGAAVLGDPLKWLDLIDRYRVTHTWSPNFGFRMLADALAGARTRRWDLSCVKGFVNAGEQVTLPVVRDFLNRVSAFGVSSSAMQPAFGMAEVCTCMTYERFDAETSVHRWAKSTLHCELREAREGEEAATFVDCGPVVKGVQIRIADTSNSVVREGTIGRLQIKGPVVTPGYLNNSAANDEAMVGDGWFNSGDLGFIWRGQLTITGREKELIIVNGANYYCYDIEDVAGEVRGVLPTFAAACGIDDPATGTEALAIFFVHDREAAPSVVDVVRHIRAEVGSRVGLSPACVVPLTRDEFPKTTSGKIQRGQLKQSLLAGTFRDRLKDLDVRLENANTVPDWFYRKVWRRRQLSPTPATAPAGLRVVFSDGRGIGQALAARWHAAGIRCVVVEPGEESADDSKRLLQAVTAEHGAVDQIVYLRSCDDVAGDAREEVRVERMLERSVYGVLAVVQALADAQPGRSISLIVVSSGASFVREGDAVEPARSAVMGLLKTIPSELEWLHCLHVDLDLDDSLAVTQAALLDEECRAATSDTEVAYRRGDRWVGRVARVDLAGAPVAPTQFKTGGLYLLTGGLGGIGIEVARHLLSRHGARLLIVGRTPLHAEGLPGDRDGDEIRRVESWRSLQRISGDVLYVDADVTDAAALTRAVDRASADFGRSLDGVIHLAGVFVERPLSDETPATMAATLAAKVQGTLALHRLLAGRSDVLFVTFSSAYGSFGGFGAGAYACANAFLDGFVHWQRQHSAIDSRSIAWTIWNETGMSQGYGQEEAARARGYRLISRRQGLNSLLAALHRDLPHLIVGLDETGRAMRNRIESTDLAARQLVAYITAEPGADRDSLLSSLAVNDRWGRPTICASRLVDTLPRTAGADLDRRIVASAPGAAAQPATPRSDLERVVAGVWREALKLDDLGIHDNFFDLGGTSFLAGQIAGRLRDALETNIVSTQMFQFPTIAAQAAFLADGQVQSSSVDASHARGAARRDAARRLYRGAPPAGAEGG